jgi:hypothetical protein
MKLQQVIDWCVPIIEEYAPMTVRQLYYQLVVRGHIPNNRNAYCSFDRHLTIARGKGLIAPGNFVDRSRTPRDVIRPGYSSLRSFLNAVRYSYSRDPLEGQSEKVEVWIEKDALAQIVADVLAEWRPTVIVTRGYSPFTLLHEARERLSARGRATILYFGDFDPTGLDIYRDITENMGSVASTERVALTEDQIAEYSLVPQVAKQGDSRTAKFVERYGDGAYELDALPPDVFRAIVREAFLGCIDEEKVRLVAEREEAEIQELGEMVDSLIEEMEDDDSQG